MLIYKELLLKRINDPIYTRNTKLAAIIDYCELLKEEYRANYGALEPQGYMGIRNEKKRLLSKLGIML